MILLNKISQLPDKKRWWTAIAITFVIAAVITIIGIYGIGEYGLALFILTPFFVGFSTTAIYGYNHKITKATAFTISAFTICIMTLALLVFAIEGIICIVMATPLSLLLMWFGSLIGHYIISKKPSSTITSMVLLILVIPLTSFVENKTETENITSVVTSIKINASQETVWENVC